VDGCRISSIDTSACQELSTILQVFEKQGVQLLFAALPGPVRDVFERFGMKGAIGTAHAGVSQAPAGSDIVHLSEDDAAAGFHANVMYLTVTGAIDAITGRSAAWRRATSLRGRYYDSSFKSSNPVVDVVEWGGSGSNTVASPGDGSNRSMSTRIASVDDVTVHNGDAAQSTVLPSPGEMPDTRTHFAQGAAGTGNISSHDAGIIRAAALAQVAAEADVRDVERHDNEMNPDAGSAPSQGHDEN